MVTATVIVHHAMLVPHAKKCTKNIERCIQKMKTLYKYVLSVRGMRCGMCEVHIEEHVSRNIKDVKVSAKRSKKQVTITSKEPIEENTINQVMKDSGYYFDGIIEQSIVQKKSLFERLFKKK